MRFIISSGSPCQSESVLLRPDEQIDRLYYDMERLRPYGNVYYDSQNTVSWLHDMWRSFQERTLSIDHQMKREKKCAQFSELLAGIILYFEQNFFHDVELIEYSAYADRVSELRLDDFELGRFEEDFEEFLKVFAEFVTSGLESAHKVVVSALALLSFVYRYLIGCVDKVGGKTYSPGSFSFRLVFVAIVLFLGSYVWIKCRQASFTANRRKRNLRDESDGQAGGVYRRAVKDSRGEVTHYKYEPRFKPLREKSESGPPLSFNCLSLGSYNTCREAEIVRHIAVVLYGEEEGRPVQFEDGLRLPFPSVTERENCPPSGKEKAVWVTRKTKDLYAELLREKARRLQLPHPAVETAGSHHGHGGEASHRGASASAPGAPSTAIELACFTSPHGGNGVVEEPTTSESNGLGQEAPVAGGVYSAYFSDSEWEQIFSSMPQREENDFPAMDDLDKVVGDFSETDRVFSFESTSGPPQSSALVNLTSAIVASLPQLGFGDQGLEILEPPLNSATAITFQQLESRPEQVQLQLRVTCPEKRPEEFARSKIELQQKLRESEDRNSELEQKLLESEERNSELEQKLRKAEVENEKWRSICRQMVEIHVSPSSRIDVSFQHGRISC